MDSAWQADMVVVPADPALYRWTGGAPPILAELEQQHQRQAPGQRSPDERWLDWVVRRADGKAVGYVQAGPCAAAVSTRTQGP